MTVKHWIALGVAKLLLVALGIGVVFGIVGCNTVRGIGQDLERVGEAIQKSSNR